jgi:predicted ATPase
MISTLAISNYRSLLRLIVPLGQLNVVTGPNASGKSNLYRALRLLAETAQDGVVRALAHEGGLGSTQWAGPETLSRAMRNREVPVQGTVRREAVRVRLGFASDDFSYAISLGYPPPSASAFGSDPEIKRECIWSGALFRPASVLIDRDRNVIKVRADRGWNVITDGAPSFESMFSQIADPARTPELFQMRERLRSWRFYDHFRTDRNSPARSAQLGTLTPVLHHDGNDLAAALQTIREIGDPRALDEAVQDAFPGASLSNAFTDDGRFLVHLKQEGLLRSLSAAELSDGTLRYILWIAALLTPRPPSLMVLNEPETSLHPDLLPALARLIIRASENTQTWVVSHSSRLIAALNESPACNSIELEKDLGETRVAGQRALDEPAWQWPDKG